MKASGLRCLRRLQAHIAMGKHIFLNHVGQGIGRVLAVFGQPVQAPGKCAHDERDCRKEDRDDQSQPPVLVKQVAHQGQQGQTVAQQRGQGVDQQHRAGLNLIDEGVGEGTGRLLLKQAESGIQQFVKHGTAHQQQAAVGDLGQCQLRQETGEPAHAEKQDKDHRHHPDFECALLEPLVQQGLEQVGNHGLGQGKDQCRAQHQQPGRVGLAEIGQQASQSSDQLGWRFGCGRRHVGERLGDQRNG